MERFSPPFNQPVFGEAGIRKPSQAGSWQPLWGSLADYAEQLDVGPDIPLDEVKSAPDPWAQPISFIEALRKEDHPLHDDTRVKWRGLLALFALEAAFQSKYSLQLQAIRLKDSSKRFTRVLSALLPHAILPLIQPEGSGWETPVVVSVRLAGVQPSSLPVAMLNPACLISSGRSSEDISIESIPWMKGGVHDPLSLNGKEALPVTQVKMLVKYLEELAFEIRRICVTDGPGSPYLQSLLRELAAYQESGERILRASEAGASALKIKIGPGSSNERLPPIYRILQRDVVIDRTGVSPDAMSQCIIPLRPQAGLAPFQGIVLMDPEIATTLKTETSRIFLWGPLTLQEALSAPKAARDTLYKEIASHGYLLVEPGDFFTPVMFRLDRSEEEIASHDSKFRHALLPLSHLSLLVGSVKDLLERLDLRNDGEVVLNVSLLGDNLDRIGHGLRRTYNTDDRNGDGLLIEDAKAYPELVAIWPDFQGKEWRHYYARLMQNKGVHGIPKARSAISGQALSGLLTTFEDKVARATALQDMCRSGEDDPARADKGPPIARLRSVDTEIQAIETQFSATPFEAVLFSTTLSRDSRPVPAGMVVFDLRPARVGEGKAIVAVDFGTTNTVACFEDCRPIDFKPRLFHPIKPANGKKGDKDRQRLALRFEEFFPPESRITPTPSVVLRREMDAEARKSLKEEHLDLKLMFQHVAYFPPQDEAGVNSVVTRGIDKWAATLTRAEFGLKWATDTQNRVMSQHYLGQIMLMIAAEAFDQFIDLNRLTWRFSSPASMIDAEDFEGRLTSLLRDISPPASEGASRLEPLRSEGLSAANYILTESSERNFARGDINIIMDIGGGSTDVAIWNAGAGLVWSGSYRIAGSDFFTGHIRRNPKFLASLGLQPWTDLITAKDDGKPQMPVKQANILELLFSGPMLNQAFDDHWANIKSETETHNLLNTSFVFLAGMAWYLGLVRRSLVDNNIVDGPKSPSVTFALCGRGAGIFERVHRQGPNDNSVITRLLSVFFKAAGLNSSKSPTVFISKQPKIEVVAGMVIDGAVDTTKQLKVGLNLAAAGPEGLAMAYGVSPGRLNPVEITMPASDEHYGPEIELGMEGLDAFVSSLGKVGMELSLNDQQRQRVQNGTIDKLRQWQLEKNAAQRQPVFIYALIVLVDLMASPDEKIRPTVTSRMR